MSRLRAQRPWLLAWVLAWMCCLVSLDVLHNTNHALEGHEAHHTCLVCEFGHQPAQATPTIYAAALIAPTYTEVAFADTGTPHRSSPTSPQPLIPRGPPAPFLFAS